MTVNIFLAVWAWLLHRKRVRSLPETFWPWVRISAGLFAFQIVTGLLLLALGYHLPTWLHLMYAGFTVLTVGAQEMLRPGANMRRVLAQANPVFDEPYWYGILALGNALFAMRQIMTGLLGF